MRQVENIVPTTGQRSKGMRRTKADIINEVNAVTAEKEQLENAINAFQARITGLERGNQLVQTMLQDREQMIKDIYGIILNMTADKWDVGLTPMSKTDFTRHCVFCKHHTTKFAILNMRLPLEERFPYLHDKDCPLIHMVDFVKHVQGLKL
jgi:hypothetical protein